MFSIGNEIINLTLEKGTKNTPTLEYYLFKDNKLVAKDNNYKRIKTIYDKILEENKQIIEEATRKIRETEFDTQVYLKNWMNTISNNSLLGGSTIKSAKNKRFGKIK